MADEFNWDDNDTVFPTTLAVAAYLNPNGNLVIRQQADASWQTEDPFVVIPRNRIADLIQAIKALV